MRWVFLFLGLLLGVAAREAGNWSPIWARRLIERRARSLDEVEGSAFVLVATERLANVPGDWSKLIYALVWLRPKESLGASSVELRVAAQITRSIRLSLAGTALTATFAWSWVLANVMGLTWWTALPIGLALGAMVFGIDSVMVSGPLPRSIGAKVARLVPRILVSFLVAQFVGTVLLLLVYNTAIERELGEATDHGLLRRLDALGQVSSPALRFALIGLVFMLELSPLILKLARPELDTFADFDLGEGDETS